MDVELIQKINNLALDLMKKGLAQDREDAVEQAEKLLGKKNVEGYSELRETINVLKAGKQENKPAENAELTRDEIRNILEKNTTFMVKTIKEFKEKMQSLEKEVSDLKNKVAYSKLPTVNDIVSAKKVDTKAEEVTESSKRPSAAPSSHPRVGKFQEDDVSIEKFFYMGKK